jgi:two-component system, NarL family, response regulator LiaR
MANIRVSVYEDNDTLRESLSFLIMGSGTMELSGAWAEATGIIEHCTLFKPEIILMDIDMPGVNGIQATSMVKSVFPEISVLIFTVFEDKEKVFDAMCAGASGYLLKKSSSIRILEAITELHAGGAPMTGEIARKVLDFFSRHHVAMDNDYAISSRELDILKCLVNGDSYKMIAEHCFISIGTVYSHINSIYRKLHVNSKSEAVVKALKERLIQ